MSASPLCWKLHLLQHVVEGFWDCPCWSVGVHLPPKAMTSLLSQILVKGSWQELLQDQHNVQEAWLLLSLTSSPDYSFAEVLFLNTAPCLIVSDRLLPIQNIATHLSMCCEMSVLGSLNEWPSKVLARAFFNMIYKGTTEQNSMTRFTVLLIIWMKHTKEGRCKIELKMTDRDWRHLRVRETLPWCHKV